MSRRPPWRTCAANSGSAPSEKGLDFPELPGLLPHRRGSLPTLPRPPAVLREGLLPRHHGPKTQSSVFPAASEHPPAPLKGPQLLAAGHSGAAATGARAWVPGPGSPPCPPPTHPTHAASGARWPMSVSDSRAVQGLAQSLQDAHLDSPSVLYGASEAPIPGLPTRRALPAAPRVLKAGPSGNPRGLTEDRWAHG